MDNIAENFSRHKRSRLPAYHYAKVTQSCMCMITFLYMFNNHTV